MDISWAPIFQITTLLISEGMDSPYPIDKPADSKALMQTAERKRMLARLDLEGN